MRISSQPNGGLRKFLIQRRRDFKVNCLIGLFQNFLHCEKNFFHFGQNFFQFGVKMQRRWKFGLMEGSLAFPIIIAIAVFDHNHRDHPCNHHHLNHHKHCPHYPQHHNDLLVSCGTRVTRVGHGHNV